MFGGGWKILISGSLAYPALRGGHRNHSIFFPMVLRRGRTGSTIDPRLDPLNTVENQFGQQIFGCVYDVCHSFVIPTCVRADYRSVTNANGLSVDIPAPAVYVSGAVKKLSRRRWVASHDRGRCG